MSTRLPTGPGRLALADSPLKPHCELEEVIEMPILVANASEHGTAQQTVEHITDKLARSVAVSPEIAAPMTVQSLLREVEG